MITSNDKLADIICRNVNLLPIVSRFGISSNIGNSTIDELCKRNRIDLIFFLSVLNTYNSSNYFPQTDSIDLGLLIDFLTKTHDYHKAFTIPLLRKLLLDLKAKLPNAKMIVILENYLNDYIEKLLDHIEFEEQNIFPLVEKTKKYVDDKSKASLNNLKKLFSQHNNVETELSDLIIVIIQHIPENSDALLFHEILHTLSHFEKEQIDHARFEDKILVPRLLKLLS